MSALCSTSPPPYYQVLLAQLIVFNTKSLFDLHNQPFVLSLNIFIFCYLELGSSLISIAKIQRKIMNVV